MPRTAPVLLFLALWGGVAGCLGDDAQHAAQAPAATHAATLAIDGMTCASCAVTVKVALGRLPGIAEVQVDTANGRAVVRFDRAQVDAARIAAAITDAGYPSSVLSEREVQGGLLQGRGGRRDRRDLPGVRRAGAAGEARDGGRPGARRPGSA